MISLLWPGGSEGALPSREGCYNERCTVDLKLDRVARGLALDGRDGSQGRQLLLQLCEDIEVIRYRQEVLEELLGSPELERGLSELLPQLASLQRYQRPPSEQGLLYEVTWRLGELESYVASIERIRALMQKAAPGPRARALRGLQEVAFRVSEQPGFRRLQAELPELLPQVRGVQSVTVGVNLDHDLNPEEATLLSISSRRFKGGRDSLLGRLLGGGEAEGRGLAPLHTLPTAPGGDGSGRPARPMLVPLFRDLSELLDRSCRPVAAALQRYVDVNTGFLVQLAAELEFYLGAVRLVRTLRSRGLPMCRPELRPKAERRCRLTGAYNLNLALRLAEQKEGSLEAEVVRNDLELGPESSIFILTGPNRGGKTTYMTAIGLVQLLAQAGLYVPAQQAELSPVDGLYTHFPAEEVFELDSGRLGEEAQRLKEIFTRATPFSLVLLNESLATTSPRESLELARDVVRGLRLLGTRAVYTTHLHELAAEAQQISREAAGQGRVTSMVSLVELQEPSAGEVGQTVRRTFKIVPQAPSGRSFAAEVASRYGISYPQLEELLRQRGFVS
jgi:DNA mismatch repair protein MutS